MSEVGKPNNSEAKNSINVAALLRENEVLRALASAAIKLRNLGRLCDDQEATLEEYWTNNPQVTRSATQIMMLRQAFETQMEAFDAEIVKASLTGMDWATEWKRPMTKIVKEPHP